MYLTLTHFFFEMSKLVELFFELVFLYSRRLQSTQVGDDQRRCILLQLYVRKYDQTHSLRSVDSSGGLLLLSKEVDAKLHDGKLQLH